MITTNKLDRVPVFLCYHFILEKEREIATNESYVAEVFGGRVNKVTNKEF